MSNRFNQFRKHPLSAFASHAFRAHARYEFNPEDPTAFEFGAERERDCGLNEIWVKGCMRFLVNSQTKEVYNVSRGPRKNV